MLFYLTTLKYAGGKILHIRMISEGSCDTEDWSYDAENSALHQCNKLHLQLF